MKLIDKIKKMDRTDIALAIGGLFLIPGVIGTSYYQDLRDKMGQEAFDRYLETTNACIYEPLFTLCAGIGFVTVFGTALYFRARTTAETCRLWNEASENLSQVQKNMEKASSDMNYTSKVMKDISDKLK